MAAVAGKMRQDADQKRDVQPSKHEDAIALVAFLEKQVEGHGENHSWVVVRGCS